MCLSLTGDFLVDEAVKSLCFFSCPPKPYCRVLRLPGTEIGVCGHKHQLRELGSLCEPTTPTCGTGTGLRRTGVRGLQIHSPLVGRKTAERATSDVCDSPRRQVRKTGVRELWRVALRPRGHDTAELLITVTSSTQRVRGWLLVRTPTSRV